MKKRIAILVMAAALAAGTMTGCGKLNDDDIVATVGDQKITADVAKFYARYYQAQYETYYSEMMGGAETMWSTKIDGSSTYEDSVKDSVMDTLTSCYLVNSHADEYDVKLTEEEQEAIKDAAKAFEEANSKKVREAVSGDKETVEEVLTMLTLQQKMQEAMTKDVDTNVSDEEAAQYRIQYAFFSYEQKSEDGAEESEDTSEEEITDERKAEVKAQAETFASNAASQSDFMTYAEEQGQQAVEHTGQKDDETPTKEVVEAVIALTDGGTTGAIEAEDGYYVARLVALLDREATDAKKEEIIQGRKQDAYEELCDKWKKEDKIKVDKGNWKKLDFEKEGVQMKVETSETDNSENTENTQEAQ